MSTNKEMKLTDNEIKKLRDRILELEQTLDSIQSGEVDALVIKNKKGEPSIYTLEGSDQPYRILVESLAAGAVTLTDSGQISHCNKSFAKMIKSPAANIIGNSFFNYIPVIQHDSLHQLLAECKTKSCIGKFTLQPVNDSTKAKTVLLSCNNLEFGPAPGLSVVVTDVTELEFEKSKRSEVESELQKSVTLFHQFAENITEVFWLTNATMDKTIYASPAYNAVWGRPTEELTQHPMAWFEAILPEDQPHVKASYQELMDEKISLASFEYRIAKPDASIRTILVRATLLKDKESGKTTGVIGIASDITELKRTQQYLALQCLLSKILVESDNVTEGTTAFLKTICENLDWDLGEVWLLDEAEQVLTLIATWPQQDSPFAAFQQKSQTMKFKKNIGLPGLVWRTKKIHWSNNLATDKCFLRKADAEQFGLHAGIGIPIIFNNEVLGVLEFFSKKTRAKDSGITKIFTAISNQMGAFLTQKITSEHIANSLQEKEVMLKEIYHRVKNNLQVVSSLLNLQAMNINNSVSKNIFIESSARVKAMALVHEMLYQSGNLAQIEMGQYVRNLSKNLTDIYHVDASRIKLTIDSDRILLSIENAIPYGLIINELITNAFKHAFPGERLGEITITMKNKDDNIVLEVTDNGIGLPSHVDFQNNKTLGMQLIHTLTKQLGGKMIMDSDLGTKFTLTFSTKIKED